MSAGVRGTTRGQRYEAAGPSGASGPLPPGFWSIRLSFHPGHVGVRILKPQTVRGKKPREPVPRKERLSGPTVRITEQFCVISHPSQFKSLLSPPQVAMVRQKQQ
ncbi:hypothetical protein DPEC_G00313920 [Dallia pectoralis]|uniref:Uncharacterized protein n=1 Tax=Dallia pectoralis TaxID=75939 RepID=A0ACC2FC27_DALPE|nr:hypothetical protein DPEC_G00313920 [Dallia pectoralis]